ncbi:MAG: septum formation family protein [Nocardioidaceae bacterium]
MRHRATVVRALAALLTVPFLTGYYITAAPDDTKGLPKGTPDVVAVRTPEVDCSAPHTTQTAYVGRYPEALAASAERFDSLPIVKYAVPRCSEKVTAFLGATRAQLATSLFSPTTYFADAGRFAQGEHWCRCDVAVAQFGPKTRPPLPATPFPLASALQARASRDCNTEVGQRARRTHDTPTGYAVTS